VTDTINPYPINNLSSFQFSILNCDEIVQYECGSYQSAFVVISAKIHSESSKDGGTIEVSHNGSPFINIINDPTASVSGAIYSENDTIQSLGKPGYSGISDNWNLLNIDFQPEIVQSFSTLTLRFTFSSDSIQTNHDGWLIGVVSTSGMFLNIAEVQNDNLISISPNPTDDELRIYRTKLSNNSTIQILNSTGQVLYQNFHFMGDTIDTKFLADGIYLLNYSEANTFSIKKIIVQH
jgi:hypothetical protein